MNDIVIALGSAQYRMLRTTVVTYLILSLLTACGTLTVGTGGGARTVDREELDREIFRQQYDVGKAHGGGASLVRYMGSDEDFHYIHHQYYKGERTYRIRREEFFVLGTFPKTENPEEWRTLMAQGGRWPPAYHRLYEDIKFGDEHDVESWYNDPFNQDGDQRSGIEIPY